MRGLSLGDLRAGGGVELRRHIARALEPFGQPADAVGVLRMDHDQGALVSCQREHVKDLAVAQLERVVGHVDLERCVAVADERGQLLTQNLRRRIGDDEVKRVIDEGLAIGAAMIVGDRFAEALALHLGRERHQRRRAAACRRPRSAGEVVGHDRTRRPVGWSRWQCASTPPGSTRRPLASISRLPAGRSMASAAIRPSRTPMSVRNTSAAVAAVPPRITRSNSAIRSLLHKPPGHLILNAKFLVRKGIHWLRDECQVAISLRRVRVLDSTRCGGGSWMSAVPSSSAALAEDHTVAQIGADLSYPDGVRCTTKRRSGSAT